MDSMVSLELPASFQYLNILTACVGALLEHAQGVADKTVLTYNVQTAVQELATNIVGHAVHNPDARFGARMYLDAEARCFVIETRDRGDVFDPTRDERAVWRPKEGKPRLFDLVSVSEVEWDAEHGRGLFLMYSLMDRVSYENVEGENCWRMEKNLR